VKIVFDKVGTAPHPFSLSQQAVTMEGELHRKSSHLVELSARLSGSIALDCDRCGRDYTASLDEPLRLQITDVISQDKEDLDIIEFLDVVIDGAYILESETNALVGDYHFCPQCAVSDEPIEIEY
jgi:uncharacterized metal-binding protein YceD (DUF177 family)